MPWGDEDGYWDAGYSRFPDDDIEYDNACPECGALDDEPCADGCPGWVDIDDTL